MSVYDVDFWNLRRFLTPVRLRDTVVTLLRLLRRKWLAVLTKPVETNYAVFTAYRLSTLYKLNHDGQVYSLENVLNDAFDNIARTIYITDGAWDDAIALYLVAEVKPFWLATVAEGAFTTPYVAPAVLYTSAEVYSTGPDFIVHVPTAVTTAPGYDVARLKGLVDYYKLCGKSYVVVVEP